MHAETEAWISTTEGDFIGASALETNQKQDNRLGKQERLLWSFPVRTRQIKFEEK